MQVQSHPSSEEEEREREREERNKMARKGQKGKA
jgi:hypothetical protein